MKTVILGLGSNIGDRMAHLRAARDVLAGVLGKLKCSKVYTSPAMLPPDAPSEWDIPFYNMAISGTTSLAPEILLKTIELQLGRELRGVWGPREIDIDILAMEDVLVNSSSLYVPHKGLLERDFALVPLAELAADWQYPLGGEYRGMRASDICSAKNYQLELIGSL